MNTKSANIVKNLFDLQGQAVFFVRIVADKNFTEIKKGGKTSEYCYGKPFFNR